MTFNRNCQKDHNPHQYCTHVAQIPCKIKASSDRQWHFVLFLFCLVASLPLMQIRLANAGDDLLDPSKIGVSRKTASGQDLLDPSSLRARAVKPSAGSTRHHLPSYARDMAGSVVSSLDTLTRAATALNDEVTKLDKEVRTLAVKQRTLQEQKDAKMEEYRQGLFCSGCGKTRSEILATGDTFPHPGQHIIRPTPEQIAAKERELQAPIDRITRELKDTRAKRTKAVSERDEAMLQIEYGLALWQTSISFEKSLILQDSEAKEAAYKVDMAKAESQLAALITTKKTKANAPDLSRDIKKWSDIKERLNTQHSHQRRLTQSALTNAASKAERERDELNGYFSRGTLSQLTTLVATTGFVSPGGDFNGLGGLYRMGSYNPSDHEEVLPSVNTFVIDFRNSPRDILGSNGTLPTPEAPLTQQLKDKLKDLLKCDPATGENCDPPRKNKNVGTGVHG